MRILLRRKQTKTAEGNIPHSYLYEWQPAESPRSSWYIINEKNIFPKIVNLKLMRYFRHLMNQVLRGETVACEAEYDRETKRLTIDNMALLIKEA